jgi:hypothetical protein
MKDCWLNDDLERGYSLFPGIGRRKGAGEAEEIGFGVGEPADTGF